MHVYPTCHKVIQADGYSHLKVVGEIHLSLLMGNDIELALDALVVTSLKQGLIVGMTYMMEPNLVIGIGNNVLLVRNRKIYFNNQPGNPKVSLLRVEVNRVVFPGDLVTVPEGR